MNWFTRFAPVNTGVAMSGFSPRFKLALLVILALLLLMPLFYSYTSAVAVQDPAPETGSNPISTLDGSDMFSSRRGHTSVALSDGTIVLMGGLVDDGQAVNDVWKSEDGGSTWTEVSASAAWAERGWHESVVLPGDTILLMGGVDYGGDDSDIEYFNDVWRSTDQGATWVQITGSAEWTPRESMTAGVLTDGDSVTVVIAGGNDYVQGEYVYMNDVWSSQDQGATWHNFVEEAAWSPRSAHSSVVLSDGSILLVGGFSEGGVLNDVWRMSRDNGVWSVTQVSAEAAWAARAVHATVALADGSVILMGGLYWDGHSAEMYNDVWRSEDNGATWTEVTANADWLKRFGHSCVVLPGAEESIVLMGGRVGNWQHSNQVWRSIDGGETWLQLAGAPDFDRDFCIDHQANDLWGHGWDTNEEIEVKIDYVGGGQPESFKLVTDEHGDFWVNLFDDYGVDVGIGDTLELTQGSVTIAHTVMNLTVDEVNPTNDSVTGTADPGSEVLVEIHGHDPDYYVKDHLTVETDSTGAWTAFFPAGSIEAGSNGAAERFGLGASTRIHWGIPNPIFTVDPTSNTISVHQWPPHTELTITVGDPNNPSWSTIVETDENGDYWANTESEYDIDTGDLITVTDGVTTKTHTVTSLRITGIDEQNNTISGIAEPGSEVEVQIYDHPDPMRTVVTGVDGTWQVDFSSASGPDPEQRAYNIGPGNRGNANQRDDDGDETHIYWVLFGGPILYAQNHDTGEIHAWMINVNPVNVEHSHIAEYIPLGIAPAPQADWRITAVHDIDGSGSPDLIWHNSVTGQRRVWKMDGTEKILDLNYGAQDRPNLVVIDLHDMDGDGKPDAILQNPAGGRFIWFMDEHEKLRSQLLAFANANWNIVGVDDMDNNGKTNLIWEHKLVGGRNYWTLDEQYERIIDESGGFYSTGPLWKIVAVHDMDGDGNPDIIWEHQGNGTRSLWLIDEWPPPDVDDIRRGSFAQESTDWFIVGAGTVY